MVSEASQPAACTGWTAPPERVKAVDPHRHGLKPLFDVVSLAVVELTAQFPTSKGSQIAPSIHEKRCVVEFVFLLQSVEKGRCGVGAATAEHVDFEQQLRFCVDCGVQPLFLAVDLDLFFVDRDLYVFEREGNLLAGINNGDGPLETTVDTTWADQTLTDFTDHGDDVEVADDGTVTLEVPAKGWVMYAPM